MEKQSLHVMMLLNLVAKFFFIFLTVLVDWVNSLTLFSQILCILSAPWLLNEVRWYFHFNVFDIFPIKGWLTAMPSLMPKTLYTFHYCTNIDNLIRKLITKMRFKQFNLIIKFEEAGTKLTQTSTVSYLGSRLNKEWKTSLIFLIHPPPRSKLRKI